MERKTASDFPQEVLNLFDLYVHGDIDRRAFLEQAARFATGAVTAAMMLESLRPNYAWGQQVPPDDSRIVTEKPSIDSPRGNGRIGGLFARPAQTSGNLPAVLVIHENRGLNPHIEDVARRFAVAGFLTFAPDGLSTVGGYPGTEEEGVKLFATVDKPKLIEDFIAAAYWLKKHPLSNGKLGVVGFCYGGGVSNNLAVRLGDDLQAAVPFYGGQAPAAEVPKIKAPLLLHYASNDARVNAGWPAYEEALKANGKTYTMHMYEGKNHGFHNDTTPRYDEEAAKLAWSRTIEFFQKYLRG
jgi:carboxymethylenebutenolidase